jgi:predicted ATPase
MDTDRLHILTGAPGSGKTAILEGLGDSVHTVAEPAREVIAEQRAIGGAGTSDQDPAIFVALLLQRSIEKHLDASRSAAALVLFDRGVPDCVAYATVSGVDPAESLAAAARYRYHPRVLILEPWERIYATDAERTMSFEQTIPFHAALVDAYEGAGYTLVAVPTGSVEERVAFVLDAITR